MPISDLFGAPGFLADAIDPVTRFAEGVFGRQQKEAAEYQSKYGNIQLGQLPGNSSTNNANAFANINEKVTQYAPMITQAATKYGIPADMIAAVMMVENASGNPYAVSSAGARGLMQIMPNIWAKNGENLYDPATNIDMGAKILKTYYDMSKGNWDEALQRYNGTLGTKSGTHYAALVNQYRAPAGTSDNPTSSSGMQSTGAAAKAISLSQSLVGYSSYSNGAAINLADEKPRVVDCSSLVQWAYNKAGVTLPRTAYLQYGATQRIEKSQLQPGDLIFFKNTYDATGQKGNTMNISHVGIYMGNGMMVNATGSQGEGVVVQRIDTPFWQSHYAGSGRIAGVGTGSSVGGSYATPPPLPPSIFSPASQKMPNRT